MQQVLLLLFSFILSMPVQAQIEESILLNEGELDIPVFRYPTNKSNAPLILWLPSSHGSSPNQAMTARGLAELGIETWIVDLHLAYFVDPGRASIEHFKARDIAQLLHYATGEKLRKIYVMSSGAGAIAALRGIALYQQQTAQAGNDLPLAGAILFEPILNYPANAPGEDPKYLPIAHNSSIPIYYIQPGNSTRQWRRNEIVEILQGGGSQVFLRALPGVASGFQQRPDEDLNEVDIAQRAKLPLEIKRAAQILAVQVTPEPPAPVTLATAPATAKPVFGLSKLPGKAALPLIMTDTNGQQHSINYSGHALSLVSFWASWCQPCILELPALKRLHDDYEKKGLSIITINVGESAPAMQAAIDRFSMQAYTNLSDPEGKTMKAWNVLGFPTNFLVSADGTLSHGSFGAVEWDATEVRALIDQQLE